MNKTVIIQATFIRETERAYYLDCEGDFHWFPKGVVKFDRYKDELELSEWLYKNKFPNEQV